MAPLGPNGYYYGSLPADIGVGAPGDRVYAIEHLLAFNIDPNLVRRMTRQIKARIDVSSSTHASTPCQPSGSANFLARFCRAA